jgi:hypothetical protein
MELPDAGSETVMDVKDSNGFAILDNEKAGDRNFIHDGYGFGRQCAAANSARVDRHHVARRAIKQLRAHMAAQIAIGDDPDELIVFDNADATKPFLRHFDNDFAHQCFSGYGGNFSAIMHQIGNTLKR